MVKFLLINVILFVTVFGAQSQSVYKSFAHLDRKDLYTDCGSDPGGATRFCHRGHGAGSSSTLCASG